MPDKIEASTRTTERFLGIAIYGTCVAGILALLTGLFAFFSGEWQGAGICLAAAAIAFGALVNALLRS